MAITFFFFLVGCWNSKPGKAPTPKKEFEFFFLGGLSPPQTPPLSRPEGLQVAIWCLGCRLPGARGDLNSFLKTNSKNFRKFSIWYHPAWGLTRLKIFRKFPNWEHPGAQRHTFRASRRGVILVWVVPIWKFSENSQIGTGSANSKPVQNLPPPRCCPKSENQILIVHNSDFETVTFDDTWIFDTVVTWSTFKWGSLAWIYY